MTSAQAPALRLERVVPSWAALPVAAVGVNQFSRRRQTKINAGCTSYQDVLFSLIMFLIVVPEYPDES